MLLTILLLNLILCLTAADAKSSPKEGSEGGLEDLVAKLEFRLSEMETRMQSEQEKHTQEKKELETRIKEMEAKDKEMETKLEELADKIREKDELEKEETELEASKSRPKIEVERKEIATNALTEPSLRDLPIVIISAFQPNLLTSPQTVTFDSFLANFNNADRPGGGDGVLDLDSGIFTCFTPGYYTVSFSLHGYRDSNYADPYLYLYKNGVELPESKWYLFSPPQTSVGVTSSRILVRNPLNMFV